MVPHHSYLFSLTEQIIQKGVREYFFLIFKLVVLVALAPWIVDILKNNRKTPRNDVESHAGVGDCDVRCLWFIHSPCAALCYYRFKFTGVFDDTKSVTIFVTKNGYKIGYKILKLRFLILEVIRCK